MNLFGNPFEKQLCDVTRRHFFSKCAVSLGSVALASLLNDRLLAAETPKRRYRCAGRVDGGQLVLTYAARHDRGHYYGWAALQRGGLLTGVRRDPAASFAGKWAGG